MTGAEILAHTEALRTALIEVMGWIDAWSPDFTEDDEWPATRDKVNAALANILTASEEPR